jgi:predicted RNA binding protein YcfA (HicA-like mRNA interferase family)
MATLANISGREAVKAFQKIGYHLARQEGSHMILHHPKPDYPMLVIPDHKEVAPFLLKAQIKRAHLTVEEFLSLLK